MLKLVVSISILVFGVFAAHFSGSTKDGHFGRAGQKKSRKNCVSRINDEPRSCLCFQSQGKNTFSNVNTSKKKTGKGIFTRSIYFKYERNAAVCSGLSF